MASAFYYQLTALDGRLYPPPARKRHWHAGKRKAPPVRAGSVLSQWNAASICEKKAKLGASQRACSWKSHRLNRRRTLNAKELHRSSGGGEHFRLRRSGLMGGRREPRRGGHGQSAWPSERDIATGLEGKPARRQSDLRKVRAREWSAAALRLRDERRPVRGGHRRSQVRHNQEGGDDHRCR